MKNTLLPLLGFILLSTPIAAPAQQFGDFTYTSDGSAITITGYTGPGGAVTIPSTITDLPVTTIGWAAFYGTTLAHVTIPTSVTSIEGVAFSECINLTNIAILGCVRIGQEAFHDCAKLARISLPANLASIGRAAFYGTSLTYVTIPSSVTNIEDAAFDFSGLWGAFFNGNPPSVGSNVFNLTYATVYYLPGTSGWGATFADRPAVLWNPLMKSSSVGPTGFGFNITGTADIPIVIEAATNLANASWIPLHSLNLTNGAFHFSDPNWTNYPARIYRIRSP